MKVMCGGMAKIEEAAAINDGAAAVGAANIAKYQRKIVASTMTYAHKCTYVHGTTKGAPTVKFSKDGAGKSLNGDNLLDGWEIHYIEFGTDTTFGGAPVQDAANYNTSGVIQPGNIDCNTTNWSQLKARVYDKTQFAGWLDYPPVWTPTDTANFKAASTKTQFIGMKRYFPQAIAQKEIADYTLRVGAFATLKANYVTATTAYNAYVEKAGKAPDAMGLLFGSYKFPTPVVRPSMPVPPETYTGLSLKGYPLASYAAATVGQTGQLIAAGEYIIDGEQGGYGSWTMGTLKPPDGAFHSFGVFGWTVEATGPTMSYHRNWQNMCFPAATATNGFCPTITAGNGKLTINTHTNVMIVSVWAFDFAAKAWNDAAAANKSSLILSFSISNWKNNWAAWKAPASDTQPPEVKKPVAPGGGAKMLAASAAAAAAVAAALF